MTSIDTFIDHASRLLQAYPGATLSITYANINKKKLKSQKSKTTSTSTTATTTSGKPRATNHVVFKVFEPTSGKIVKYHTNKSKELSRLLTFTGPRGVSKVNDNPSAESDHAVGVASLMANKPFDRDVPPPVAPVAAEETKNEASSPQPTNAKPSKKKKKKGKK